MNIGGPQRTRGYTWKPREDITAYELALCMAVFDPHAWRNRIDMVEALPPEARRHWEEWGG